MEMCMAWGIPPSRMAGHPDYQEMWVHWRYRNIREQQLQERQEMAAKQR